MIRRSRAHFPKPGPASFVRAQITGEGRDILARQLATSARFASRPHETPTTRLLSAKKTLAQLAPLPIDLLDPDDETAEEIKRTLDDLTVRGLLSDARAAESLLTSRAARYGSLRLRQALVAKGLAPELVAAGVQQVRATEYERALALWRRRFGTVPADAAERARQMRFLAARGFEAEVVRRVLKAGPSEAAED